MKRILALIFVLTLALGLFVGCSGDGDKESTGSNSAGTNVDGLINTADVNFVTADGDSVYRIIRPEGDEGALAVSQFLFKQMKDKLGVGVRNSSDTEDGTDVYEILLGPTNRPETKQAIEYLKSKTGGRYDDYIICTIGKKICIYSESAETLKTAAEYFVANYVKGEGVKGGIAYTKAAEGNFENITVNGVTIGEFDFVRPHYNSSWLTEVEMQEIIETVYQKTGYMLKINHDTKTDAQDYEIIVGDSAREGVSAITNYDEFTISVKGKKIYINGGSAHATAMGVSEFAKLLKGDITDSASYTGSYETAINTYDKTTNYYKTWGDDFDGDALDTTKWRQEKESDCTTGQNGKLSVRSSNPNDVFVSDGKFYICAREDEDYYYGGMIRTQGIMNYKYGYAEMSSVIPHGDSFWIAWWACSSDGMSTLDPNVPKIMSPEIDIVECFGNSKHYAANCHSWPTEYGKAQFGYEHTSLDGATYGKAKQYSCPDEGVNLGGGFHTYGFLWDNTQMSFTCDGDLFFTYKTNTNDADIETFNHSMYFIYSMALAFENAPGNPITQNPDDWQNTNKLILDWMNIYQMDDGLHELNWTGAK
jgi:beta-glucanase (GH16 family)